MCGEKTKEKSAMKMIWGSPPHVRGKDYIIPHSPPRCGITPACAGKSVSAEICRTGNKDHPRTCGEKVIGPGFLVAEYGAPPHMRGKGTAYQDTVKDMRITPAHAGKSSRVSSFLWLFWDHPRTCGEKINSFQCSHRMRGSPPHMRGKEP